MLRSATELTPFEQNARRVVGRGVGAYPDLLFSALRRWAVSVNSDELCAFITLDVGAGWLVG